MSNFDKLGDRMKGYEDVERRYLTKRTPVILRLDGRSFHTFTSHFNRPFDDDILFTMKKSAEHLLSEIQGAKMAYIQSDECSIVITDYDTIDTNSWFGNNIQKMVSIAASEFSVAFNLIIEGLKIKTQFKNQYGILKLMDNHKPAIFDARVFNIPENEIMNYLIWRQQDWIRNSIQMLSRKYYSQKQLAGKKQNDLHELIFQAGDNWAKLDEVWKNGTFYYFKRNEEGRQVLFENNIIFNCEEGKLFLNELVKEFYFEK